MANNGAISYVPCLACMAVNPCCPLMNQTSINPVEESTQAAVS